MKHDTLISKKRIKSKVFIQFIIILIPLFLVLFGIEQSYRKLQAEKNIAILRNDETNNLFLLSRLIEYQFVFVIEDLTYITQVESFLRLNVDEYDKETIKRLAPVYRSFAQRKLVYDQIRWIDLDGMELIRVNMAEGEAKIVPDEELQDKSDRPYFQQALKLGKNAIYMSEFDLNIENGYVDIPYKPVIRFAKPVFNRKGNLEGVAVLNYLGEKLLSLLDDPAHKANGAVMLLNHRGEWLYGTELLDQWNFMFPEREQVSFARLHPGVWDRIRGENNGSFINGEGMYTFNRIVPILHSGTISDKNTGYSVMNDSDQRDPYSWTLVTFISNRFLKKELHQSMIRLYYSLGGIGLIFIAASFVIANFRVMKGKADEELKEVAAIFDKNPAPVLKTDRNGVVTLFNEESRNILGYRPDTVNIEKIFPDFTEEKKIELLEHGLQQFEETIKGRTYLFTVIPQKKEQAFLIYGSDISSRKKTEEELERLYTAVEQSANTIVITDTLARILFVNKAFEKTTGYTFEEALGKNPRILKSGYHSKELYEDLWHTIRGGKTWHGQFLNRRKDGSTYWEEAVITPVKNKQGVITNYLAVKEDVTLRKEAEAELKKAKEEAESANKLKSEFLANMSHEIRTPMNAILGFTDILLDGETDKEKFANLEIIRTSGKNLLNLINDILDFSKIEAGKIQINTVEFSFRKMVERIETMFRPQAGEKRLDFEVRIDPSFPDIVTGDEYRINQIVLNIISNAFKFTDQGSVSLACSYRDLTAFISVTDTGIGIPDTKKDSIFAAFEQGDTSTERKYGGTGLGLAISSRLAQLMGGSITFESVPGKGTTFFMSLFLPENRKPRDISDFTVPKSDRVKPREDSVQVQPPDGEEMVSAWIRRMHDEADLEAILFECIQRLPEKIEKMEDAVIRDNKSDIKFLAHEIKGSTGNLGMTEIFESASALDKEISKDDYDRDEVGNLFRQLESVITSIPEHFFLFDNPHIQPGVASRNFRILLAEDNKVNQKLVQKLLGQINLSCDFADNGQIAVSKLESGGYDLLLLDMQMPVVDGEEAIIRIRANPALSGLYVIALTAHAMKGDAERYVAIGCDDYLPKPIEKRKLFEKVQARLVRKIKLQSAEDDLLDLIADARFTEIEKSTIRDILPGLKENVSIFNPAKLHALAVRIKKAKSHPYLESTARKIDEAADDFNDKQLKAIIATLENAIS